MARKTNYAFDRDNRAKAKAAKREAKRKAKLAAKTEKPDGLPDGPTAEESSAEGEGAQDSSTEEIVPPQGG